MTLGNLVGWKLWLFLPSTPFQQMPIVWQPVSFNSMGRLPWVYGANHDQIIPTGTVIISSLNWSVPDILLATEIGLKQNNHSKARRRYRSDSLPLGVNEETCSPGGWSSHLVILTEAKQKMKLTHNRGWSKVITEKLSQIPGQTVSEALSTSELFDDEIWQICITILKTLS